jgi:hypothetical protein
VLIPCTPDSPGLQAFTEPPKRRIEVEMERYSHLCSLAKGRGETNILDFWKKHSPELTMLSSLAHEYLAIPASSTACERVFFRFAPMIIDYRRNKLDPFTISHLITLQSIFKDF